MHTEAQLNSMTKTQIIENTLKLSAKLEQVSSGPVTADVIKAEYLSLKREGASIAERRQKSKENHELAIARIEAENERAIAELELKFNSEESNDKDQLEKDYEALEAKSLKAIKDLSFGLEEAENKAKVELAKITEATVAAQENFDTLEENLSLRLKELRDKHAVDLVKIEQDQKRLIEQTQYDNKIALRDENLKFIDNAAERLGKVVVDANEFKELEEFVKTDNEAVAEIVKVEVSEATSKVHAAKGAEISKMKSEYESKIALLENDKGHLVASVSSQASRIEALEQRLKDVPSQIAEAVKAAQSSVTVNQDTNKK